MRKGASSDAQKGEGRREVGSEAGKWGWGVGGQASKKRRRGEKKKKKKDLLTGTGFFRHCLKSSTVSVRPIDSIRKPSE